MPYSTYTNTAIGVFFGIFAEFFGSSGNIQIKYSHKLEEAKGAAHSQTPLFQRTRFRIACVLYVLNGIFNLISCIFASLNVLAPTSSFTIILNAALAHLYFGERLTRLGYFASLMIMCGSTVSVLFGHSESKTSFNLTELTDLVMRGGSIFFALAHWLCITGCVLIGKALSKQYDLEERLISHGVHGVRSANLQFDDNASLSDDDLSSAVDNDDLMERIRSLSNQLFEGGSSQYAIRAFCYSFATGSLASWVQFFGKAVGVLISESVGGDEQFNKLGAWLYMACACWFIYWMMILISEMMRLFDAILIVPLYETFIIFNMVLLDAVYFGRAQSAASHSGNNTVWFWMGILVCVVGMFVLTVAQKDNARVDEEVIPLMYTAKPTLPPQRQRHTKQVDTEEESDEDEEEAALLKKSYHSTTRAGTARCTQQFDLV